LIDYIKASKELTPSYDLEVYVNGENVLTEKVNDARATQTFIIDRKGGTVGATNQVRVVKRGKGSLYLSSLIEYYGSAEEVAARGSGDLSVTREYYRLKLEDAGSKLNWTATPLTGEINSGDLIVVKLQVNGRKARHLMIEDPIPAGAEQIESVGDMDFNYNNSGWSDWYSSREFRDRRTVFFVDYFPGAMYLQYVMRVQVPGDFFVAPTRAELMYQPETNANAASRKFSFLDRSHR
jgi:uncharacterized protein YfaS (alpha-2-macroglobulin family)